MRAGEWNFTPPVTLFYIGTQLWFHITTSNNNPLSIFSKKEMGEYLTECGEGTEGLRLLTGMGLHNRNGPQNTP